MILLDDYIAVVKKIHNYFGYKEGWRVLPIDDARMYYWRLDGGSVYFADEPEYLDSEDGGRVYSNEVLPNGVYRGADYTMLVVDTHTDGNQFLQIFTNSKEMK